MTKKQWFAKFALILAEHHKRHCDGAECNISLGQIKEMAMAAGAKFTKEESEQFV